jgi:23S rRNA pseudouridine1911/1915/1917 synthase
LIRPLSILFEDPFCLAVIKPAGQFTQGTWAPPGEETLEQAVRRHLNPDDPAGAYVGIVHRLDRPVSGVLLWAKTRKAARRLSKQFEARQVVKEYWAIVENPGAVPIGPPPGAANNSETWEDWLTRAGPDGRVRVVAPNEPNSRLARTIVERLASPNPPPDLARLQMWPATGRTHQLRVQAATRGLPILGDSIYGSAQIFPSGIALHAHGLKIRHPADQSQLILQAPPPESWGEYEVRNEDPV